MENQIIHVELTAFNRVEVVFPLNYHIPEFFVYKDGEIFNLDYQGIVKTKTSQILIATYPKDIALNHDYYAIINGKKYFLDTRKAIDFIGFDKRYFYDGDDLGATYKKSYTTFRLFAPLASKVNLRLLLNKTRKTIPMIPQDDGTFFVRVNGNLAKALYKYEVTHYGITEEITDPYSKSYDMNSERSAVIDLDQVITKNRRENLPLFDNYLQAIVYETNIRDFTIHPNTNIKHKGKYLGFVEKGRKTKKKIPAGLDYLCRLGITHVQLMPVCSIWTTDDKYPLNKYNWGYDPESYFALEGSYSSNPGDPYCRMKEFRKVVDTLHEKGLRVVLDVVYNHVYEGKLSMWNKAVPNYYFRRDKKNNFYNASGCGCDFASERVMARKMIIDSIKFLLETYDVDGFRFDLMGLIDLETMQKVAKEAKAIKHDVMLYGEGWVMGLDTTDVELANMGNAKLLPDYAFFNDSYRNIVKGLGGHAKLDDNGYLFGNEAYDNGFKFVYLGSALDVTHPHIFEKISQSLNYVECHDNATLFDNLVASGSDADDQIFRRVKLFNKVLLHSFGIPFIHSGQEIGLSKCGHSNTYNEGDKYNQFDYDVLDERVSLADSFRHYIHQRKSMKIFTLDDKEYIKNHVEFIKIQKAFMIEIDDEKNDEFFKMIVNPSNETIYYSFDTELELYSIDRIDNHSLEKNAMIFPITMKIFVDKE